MRRLKAACIALVLAAAFSACAPRAAEPGEAPVMVEVTGAHRFYDPTRSAPEPVYAENLLRMFALNLPDPVVDRNLAWVRQSDWQAGFKTLFARAVRWVRTTRKLGPDELYRVAHELFARPNARKQGFRDIGVRLLYLAARKGHAQAKRENKEWSRKIAKESRNRVPKSELHVADIVFRGLGREPDPVAAANLLRAFALSESDRLLDLHFAWVQQSGWSSGFKTLFARAVAWARKTRQLGPDDLDRLARDFRARPRARDRYFDRVARQLRRLAAAKRKMRARSRKRTKDQ